MSILVCGGAGYIGAHVVRLLRQRGDRVVVVDDLSTSNAARIGDTPLVRLDVATDEARSVLSNLMVDEDVTAVIHFSARKQVGESVARPTWYYQQNIGGMANVLAAMEDTGVDQMIFSSSAAVYGIPTAEVVTEDMAGHPINPYGETKLIGEWMMADCERAWDLKWIGLRYFNVFGQRQDPYGAYAAVIPQWFAALTKGDTVYVNGDGETSRDFCYIDNVVQANLLASYAAEDARDLVYNVAFGQRTTLNELFGLIRDEVVRHKPEAAEAKPAYRDFRAGDVRHSLADITRARTLLGYEPEYDVRQGLRLAGDWYDAHL